MDLHLKLETHHADEEKDRWKVVRTDNYGDVPGKIITADEDTGNCVMSVPKIDDTGHTEKDANGAVVTEAKEFSFGPMGIRLIGRGRR